MNIKPNQYYYADLSPCHREELGGLRIVKVVAIRDDLVQVIPITKYGKIFCEDKFQIRAIGISRLRERVDRTDYDISEKDISELIEMEKDIQAKLRKIKES